MKSIKSATLDYPIVIRKVLNDLVIAVPDLGYWQTIPFSQIQQDTKTANSAKDENVKISENYDDSSLLNLNDSLNLSKTINHSKSLNNDTATDLKDRDFALSDKINLSPAFFEHLNKALELTWTEVEQHRLNKKWVPTPSTFKNTIQKSEKDFTLPAFTEELQKYMNISENTVRREIKRGAIQCYTTEGNHRRIPFAELELYLNKRKVKTPDIEV